MKKIFYLLLLIILIVTCKKEELPELPNYPDVPTIEFEKAELSEGIDVLGNQKIDLKLFLYYTDGDSNLGGNYFTNGEYNEESEDKYDCIIALYKKTNGELNLINTYFENPLYLYFPEILNSIIDFSPLKIKPYNKVEGKMEISLDFYGNPFSPNDTLKFAVQILDRDLNYSNITEIEKIYIQ